MNTPPLPPEAAAAEQTLHLPPVFSIETVEAVASEIAALPLNAGTTLILDASATEILTTPGAQLLLSLDKTLSQIGGTLCLRNAGSDLAATMKILGLDSQFNTWSNANG